MNDEHSSGFVRRMSALARKGRSRSKRDHGMSVASAGATSFSVASPNAVGPGRAGSSASLGSTSLGSTSLGQNVQAFQAEQIPFVNHGLEYWNQQRREWTTPSAEHQNKRPFGRYRDREASADNLEPIDGEELYNELLSPQYVAFPRPIPLGEIIEVLLDVWEHDGLFI